jgi:hypothetical protein
MGVSKLKLKLSETNSSAVENQKNLGSSSTIIFQLSFDNVITLSFNLLGLFIINGE